MISSPKGIETPMSEPMPDVSGRQSSSWDISNAPRNYGALVAFQIGSAVFSFASIWLVTHYLGSEGYGGVVAIIAASQVAQVFVNWTSVAVVRFGVDEFVDTHKIARTFWVRFIVLSINLAIVLALSPLWFPPLAAWLKLTPAYFGLVMSHFAVTVIWIHVQMSLQGAKLPRTQGFLMMIERLLIFAGFVALTLTASLTQVGAAVCYIAAPAAMIFLGLFTLRKYIFSRFSVDRAFFRKIIAYSAPLAPMALVGYFSGTYLDAIFISRFLSISDLGVYSIAAQIVGITLQIPTLANTLLLPLFVSLTKENQSHRLRRFFSDVSPTATLLGGVLCTFLSLIGYYLIPLAFGSDFSNSRAPLWILFSSSTVALPVLLGYSALSHSLSTTYISMLSAILGAITNVFFNAVLIPPYGLNGCAVATLISYIISVLTYLVLLKRTDTLPRSWVFLAMLPNAAATIAFLTTAQPWFAAGICLAGTAILVYVRRDSLTESLSFVRNIVFRGESQGSAQGH